MAKRGENIYKRKDNRYEGRYIKGYRPDGKPFFGYIYGYTYTEVKSALNVAKASAKQDKQIRTIGKGSLAEFLVYWLNELVKDTVKSSTYAQYHERVYSHIIPELGKIPVCRLSKEQSQSFINHLNEKGLAASTVRNIAVLLGSAMKKARELHLTNMNPCDGLTLPRTEGKERRALDRTEQIRLECQLHESGACLKLAVLLALYAGLRIGEICALRWEDIDLLSGTLTVRGTLQRVKNYDDGGAMTKLYIGAPKSSRSLRKLPLPPALTDKLREHGGGMEGVSFVLTGSETPVEPRTLRARFSKLAEKAGLDIPFHSLRHTFSTRCLENNFDVQTLSELLGHATASTTMKVYAHSVFEHKRMLTGRIHILSENYEPSSEPSQAVASY